jgi:hypothetical protein
MFLCLLSAELSNLKEWKVIENETKFLFRNFLNNYLSDFLVSCNRSHIYMYFYYHCTLSNGEVSKFIIFGELNDKSKNSVPVHLFSEQKARMSLDNDTYLSIECWSGVPVRRTCRTLTMVWMVTADKPGSFRICSSLFTRPTSLISFKLLWSSLKTRIQVKCLISITLLLSYRYFVMSTLLFQIQ